MAVRAVEVFFVYSYKDKELRDGLAKYLTGLQYWEELICWHDRCVEEEGDKVVTTYVKTADIILLLISPAFLNSSYCQTLYEITAALRRYTYGEVKVIPILLRSVSWTNSLLNHLQSEVLPKKSYLKIVFLSLIRDGRVWMRRTHTLLRMQQRLKG